MAAARESVHVANSAQKLFSWCEKNSQPLVSRQSCAHASSERVQDCMLHPSTDSVLSMSESLEQPGSSAGRLPSEMSTKAALADAC